VGVEAGVEADAVEPGSPHADVGRVFGEGVRAGARKSKWSALATRWNSGALGWQAVAGAFPGASDVWVRARTVTMWSTIYGFLALEGQPLQALHGRAAHP